jgi:thiol-disulfide isomerase/thioredoxin
MAFVIGVQRRTAVAGVLAVLAVAGLTAMAGCSSDDGGTASVTGSGEQATTETGASTDGSGGGDGDGASQAGQYLDYSPELVASTPGEKLLFFHAPWCSQCVKLEDDIEASGVPDGVTVFKVDYDSNQDLRRKYGVTIQTTMVKVGDGGKKLDSYVAYEDPTFDSVSAALLK